MASNSLLSLVDGQKHCGSGDIMILGCHMISQDHVIKGLCYFMGRNPGR